MAFQSNNRRFGFRKHLVVRGAERACRYSRRSWKSPRACFFPPEGRTHFGEDEKFTEVTSSGTNLLWVATHEFGQALGIERSNVRSAIMYPNYNGYVPNMKLHSGDQAAIFSLYGNVVA